MDSPDCRDSERPPIDGVVGPRNKAERLAVASAIAPTLRAQAERTGKRRVALVDADGKVVGYTSLADVQKAILERAKIELAVSSETKPRAVVCKQCGNLAPVSPRSRGSGCYPRFCQACMRGRCIDCGVLKPGKNRKAKPGRCAACRGIAKAAKSACADCGAKMAKSAWYTARKAGRAARCRPCAAQVPRHKKPTCPRGHDLNDPAIGIPRATGGRDCRVCARTRQREARARQREGKPAS